MTSIEPELWVDAAREAIAYYEAAFGATVLHRVGDGDEIVAELAVGDARVWISSASANRPSPRTNRGATGRMLLVVDDPDDVVAKARAAGASELSPVKDEHGWRLGRIQDPRNTSGRSAGRSAPDRLPTGDERHSESQSGPTADSVKASQLAAGRSLPSGPDVTAQSKQQA